MVDIPTGGVTQVTNTGINTIDNEPQARRAGAGNAAQNGPAPDATTSTQTTSVILAALSSFIPQLAGEQLDVLLAEATSKLKDVVGEVQTKKLLADEEAKSSSLDAKAAKLDEAEGKRIEAKEKRESANIWEKISLAFQALGAAISIIVGSVLIATGVATAAGAALIAVGLIGIALVIDSIVKMTSDTGLGIFGNIAYEASKAEGKSDAEAREIAGKVDMSAGIILSVAAIAVSIVALAIPGGQASAVSSITQAVGTISSALSGIGSAVTSVGASANNYQATKATADSSEIKADSKELEALLLVLDDFIDELLSQISGNSQRFNAILEDIVGSIQDRGNTLARAQFSA